MTAKQNPYMNLDFRPVAFDIETSSSDPAIGKVLSLALLDYFTGKSIALDIRRTWLGVVPAAMRVNQIDIQIMDSAERLTVEQANALLNPWLDEVGRGFTPRALGLNVASFDLNFIKEDFPELSGWFGYQAIELNSLYFAAASQRKSRFWGMKTEVSQEAEEKAKAYYPDYRKHDAYSDVLFNCFCFEIMTDLPFAAMKEA